MDRTFEYRVLAYLDGQLDRREERAFLREVARDPAKRAVLAQHRELSAALGDRKNPVAVPLKTQQALAEKIPALRNVVPKAAPVGAGIAGGTAASIFSGKIVSLIIVGGTLIGSIGFVLFSGSATDDAAPAEKLVNARSAESAVTSKSSAGASAFRETDGEPASAKRLRTAASPAETSSPDHDDAASAAEQHLANLRAHHSATSSLSATRSYSGSTEAAEVLTKAHHSETRTAAVADRAANDASDAAIHSEASINHRAIPAPLLGTAAEDAPAARTLPRHTRFVERNALRELFDGRLYAYLETGAAQYDMRGAESASRSITKGVYLAGLRYDFTSSIAGGVEFGQSTFAREGYSVQRTPLAPGSGTEIVVVDNTLISENQPWLRAHLLWTLNPEQRLRLQADAGSGILLGSDNALLFSLGLSSVYAVSPVLQMRAGVHYSGTWLSPSGTPPVISSGSGVIGIIHNARDAGTAYSSAIELRIGFGVLIW